MAGGVKRYDALDGLRAISCVGIAMMHVLANTKYNLAGFTFEQLIPSFTKLVFLFMTLSGFGMCCGYYERIKNRQIDFVDFYKKRYAKIWPFFAMLCLLDFAMSPSINSLYEVFANLTMCFGLLPNPELQVIGVGWFLGTVFVFYLMFPFFVFLLSNKKRAWFSFTVSILMNYVSSTYFGVKRASIVYSFMFFMAGGMVYIYREKIEKMNHRSVIFLTATLLTGLLYFTVAANQRMILLFCIFALLYGIGARDNNILNARLLRFLGNISFEIYLCHMVIFRIIERMNLLYMTNNNNINYFLTVGIVLMGAISFACLWGKASSKVKKIINQIGDKCKIREAFN